MESAYLLICSIYCKGPGVGGSRLSMCVTALLGANLTQTIELFRLAVEIYWYLLFGFSIHEIRICICCEQMLMLRNLKLRKGRQRILDQQRALKMERSVRERMKMR